MTETHPQLAPFPDAELIEEMKKRGYRVIKKEKVQTFSARQKVSISDLYSAEKNGYLVNMMDSQYRIMGRALGEIMLVKNAVPIAESVDEAHGFKEFTATVMVIVDTPYFDWPMHLLDRMRLENEGKGK